MHRLAVLHGGAAPHTVVTLRQSGNLSISATLQTAADLNFGKRIHGRNCIGLIDRIRRLGQAECRGRRSAELPAVAVAWLTAARLCFARTPAWRKPGQVRSRGVASWTFSRWCQIREMSGLNAGFQSVRLISNPRALADPRRFNRKYHAPSPPKRPSKMACQSFVNRAQAPPDRRAHYGGASAIAPIDN